MSHACQIEMDSHLQPCGCEYSSGEVILDMEKYQQEMYKGHTTWSHVLY